MSGFNNLKKRSELSGGSIRQSKINDARWLIKNESKHDPSFCQTMFFWIGGESPNKGEQLYPKIYKRSFSAIYGNVQSFQTCIDEKVEIGDCLYDESQNTYWICTESFNIDDIHFSGKLHQCNWILTWQRENGVIVRYPCIEFNATQYNSGETSTTGGKITIGSAQHIINIPYSEDTVSLDSPQRFIIDRNMKKPTVYKITQNDTVDYNFGKGILNITIVEDQFQKEVDKLVLLDSGESVWIADYSPTPQLPVEDEDITYTITGDDELWISTENQYTAEIITDDSNASFISYTWDVQANDSVIWNVDDNVLTISCKDRKSIGQKVTINLLIDGEIKASKEVLITNFI